MLVFWAKYSRSMGMITKVRIVKSRKCCERVSVYACVLTLGVAKEDELFFRYAKLSFLQYVFVEIWP